MITIGVDAHKTVHAAVALDEAGREVDRWRGDNSSDGWHALWRWARELGEARRWGIEGAWGYDRGLARHLVEAGETVHEVNARWTAAVRRRGRRAGKHDAIDARAVAEVVRREGETLPRIHLDEDTEVLGLLVREREAALAKATRLRHQLHALLLQLDPEYRSHLQSQAGLRAVLAYVTPRDDPLAQTRAAAVRRLAERLKLALAQADELEAEIGRRAEARFSPLREWCGVSRLTAGAPAGVLGPLDRFTTEAQLAAHAGVAPLEASSAGTVRHRLNRTGNRRLNAIVSRIALTQARHSPEARTYLARRVAEGKTRREALRALKRFIIRAIWRLWRRCAPATAPLASTADALVAA